MRQLLRILSIEDEPKDADLIKSLLETEGIVCDITRVENQADFLAALKQGGIDLILADYRLPSFDGISALKLAMKGRPDVPFIFVSGTLGEEVAIDALKLGATDYVLKTSLSRLAPSVERALREGTQRAERKRTEEALRKSEAYLAEAQKLSHTGSFGWKASTGEIFWSDETFRIFQYDRSTKPTLELIAQRVHPEDAASFNVTAERASRDGKDFEHEYRLVMPDGGIKHVYVVAHAEKDESGEIEFVGAVMDVTERKRAAEALLRTEAYLAEGQKLSHTATWACDIATREMIHSSAEHRRLFGLAPETVGIPPFEEFYQRIHPDDQDPTVEDLERAMAAGSDLEAHFRVILPDGTTRYMYGIGRPLVKPSGETSEYVGAVMDVTEQKQAEEALRRSENYLAEAQRLSHTGSWASIPAMGEIRYLSEECYRVMGFDPHGGQPRYEAFFERIYPDDQAKVTEAVETAGRENKDFELDYRIVHPGGEIRDIHVVGHPVLSPSGDLVEYVGTVIDITERKRAEDRTRLIIDTVPAQLWTESPEGVVDFVNRRWIDYTGMTLEQAVGSGWNRMVHPDDIQQVLSKWRTLVSEGKPREIESRLRRSDGEYRWFLSRCYPLVDRSGHILGWYGSDTDIHDRKVAEETLRRSEGYLAEAQRLSHTGSWASKPASGENTYWSEECYRLMGFDPHGGQPGFETVLQRYHPDDQGRVREAVQRAEREKAGFELDYRIIHPGGETRDIHVIGHPVLSPSGDFVEFVGTVMDITERKQAEDERERLRQAQADLARVNRVTTMGELTASLAHEVNQPIAAAVTSANSCIRWLAGDAPNLDKARAAAARIVKDGTRAAEIFSRLRVLFQKGSLQLELLDVNEVIEEMIVLLRGEAAQYSISVRTELAADLPQVMGDRVQLQQVMMNLMLNSIDATKAVDGTRELAIESRRMVNEQLQVSVRDTGIGLPANQLDQIFDAFFTTKPHGTGMGLRICRSIVESHGGHLWAAKNLPRGASFYVSLPAQVEARE